MTSVRYFRANTEPSWNDMELEQMAQAIESCLAAYFIAANVSTYSPGPVFTLFRLTLEPGVRISKITALIPELIRALAVRGIQVLDSIPGTSFAGLLITNNVRQIVSLESILNSSAFAESPSPLTLMIGVDSSGQPVAIDLNRMPHLLVVGTANSGKSLLMHAIIISLLLKSSPDDVRLILVDTNQLELAPYHDIPHLLTPVITAPEDAGRGLRWLIAEMERRYKLFQALGSRNLDAYNRQITDSESSGRPIPDPYWIPEPGREQPFLCSLPHLVFLVEDYADILACDEPNEEMIVTLTRQGHAVGIHLILTTRTPLPNVITSRIKSNIPARIALKVSTKSDSRLILDHEGAESLFGAGDLLFLSADSATPARIQGAYADAREINKTADAWRNTAKPCYIEGLFRAPAIAHLSQKMSWTHCLTRPFFSLLKTISLCFWRAAPISYRI
ncbi:hypothetical protein GTU79_21960 [Sodalis ligni]|uniref:DNA translocase FtsK n=1 Tax=Sodalis ligni TaxID=2697027 RepID=UPI001BDEB139|nr:DNA translocase FtsK [Sodalis ligni]QWA09938.1 hypothetical protein GTU79_21960 [Sodalis ligni]